MILFKIKIYLYYNICMIDSNKYISFSYVVEEAILCSFYALSNLVSNVFCYCLRLIYFCTVKLTSISHEPLFVVILTFILLVCFIVTTIYISCNFLRCLSFFFKFCSFLFSQPKHAYFIFTHFFS